MMMEECQPTMIYGTAWKKEETATLVEKALGSGFRAIDVAAHPKHYREDLVGEGIRASLEAGYVKRKDIYVSFKISMEIASEKVFGLIQCVLDSNQVQLGNRARSRRYALRLEVINCGSS
jgi:diketogulonate reductase-like aldo/keto reductase